MINKIFRMNILFTFFHFFRYKKKNKEKMIIEKSKKPHLNVIPNGLIHRVIATPNFTLQNIYEWKHSRLEWMFVSGGCNYSNILLWY